MSCDVGEVTEMLEIELARTNQDAFSMVGSPGDVSEGPVT